MLQAKNVQYTDIGVRHQMGPQAQALHLPAAPLPAQAAWALASSQPDLSTLLLSVGETLSEAMYCICPNDGRSGCMHTCGR